MKDTLKAIFDEEVNTPKVGYFWKGLALFLLGVIVGFMFAPIKKGIKIGCNNGNNCTDSGNFNPDDSFSAEGCCGEQ